MALRIRKISVFPAKSFPLLFLVWMVLPVAAFSSETSSVSTSDDISEFVVEDPAKPTNEMVKELYEQGAQNYRLGNRSEALRILEVARQEDPTHSQVKALIRRIQEVNQTLQNDKTLEGASALWKDGQGKAALENLAALLRDYPDYQPALALKKEILGSQEGAPSNPAEELVSRAKKAESDHSYREASRLYQKALRKDPGNEEARKGLERTNKLAGTLGRKAKAPEKKESGLEEGANAKAPVRPKSRSKLEEELRKDNEIPESNQALADNAYNNATQAYGKGDFVTAKLSIIQCLENDPHNARAQGFLERLRKKHPELWKKSEPPKAKADSASQD